MGCECDRDGGVGKRDSSPSGNGEDIPFAAMIVEVLGTVHQLLLRLQEKAQSQLSFLSPCLVKVPAAQLRNLKTTRSTRKESSKSLVLGYGVQLSERACMAYVRPWASRCNSMAHQP